MKPARVSVIYNPVAGRGRAGRRVAELRQRLGPDVRFLPTDAPGHGEELAYQQARTGVPVVAAAGGDGTVHEVACGILRAELPQTCFAVLPVGSANDYAESLDRPGCWAAGYAARFGPGEIRAVDVGLVQSPGGRRRYFVNSLGLGFNAGVTVESRRIPRLQGTALYGVAVLRALWSHFDAPEMTVEADGETRRGPTLTMSVAIGPREGNFVLSPAAVLDDGEFELLHAGRMSLSTVLPILPGVLLAGKPPEHPGIWRRRCRTVRVASGSPLNVHVDGEFYCRKHENVREIEVRLLPAAMRVTRLLGP